MEIQSKAKEIEASEGEKPVGQRSENLLPQPILDLSQIDTGPWNFNQLYGMKRHFGTYDITPSSTGVVFSFVNTPANVLDLFGVGIRDYFQFFRYDIVFEMELQSSFQHVGALVVNLTNYGHIASGSTTTVGQVQYCTRINTGFSLLGLAGTYTRVLLPHSFITLGHNGNYKVVVPWLSNRKMLPTESRSVGLNEYFMGELSVAIFSPMLVAAGVFSTTSLRVWVNLENVQYTGYNANYTI